MLGWNAFALLAVAGAGSSAPLPQPEQIMQIPPALQAQLHDKVIRAANSPEQRLHRLVEFVFLPSGLNLQYAPDATLTVAETYTQRRANCLSFTLLFVALARAAGLDARVQEVGQVVTWYQDQGVIYNAGHVNVGLRLDGRTGTLDLDQNVLYDRRGPRTISDQRAFAHFYNNRGAELMAAEDPADARASYQKALQMDPRFAATWNNLGVLDLRQADITAAKHDFDTALSIAPNHAPTLANASAFYLRLGDNHSAALLDTRLQHAQRSDPFYQFMQGAAAERAGDYTTAVTAYRHAVRLYGNAHQFHFGLARVYFLSGDNRRAERELEQAQKLGGSDQARALYQAKLDSLRRVTAHTAAR